MYSVYLITNKINGKKYVGLTKRNVLERFKEHISIGDKTTIGKAIKKYGSQNFNVSILEKNIETLVEATSIEQYYIAWYNTFYGEGYNLTLGGEGTKGSTLSERHKESIRNSKIGIPRSTETRKKISKTAKLNKKNAGVLNPMFGNGYKISGKNNGRHRDNFKGDLQEVSKNIKKGLEKVNRGRGFNPQAKKYYVLDTLTGHYTDIDKGHLRDFCRVFNIKYTTLFNTLYNKQPLVKGPNKGYQLFKGSPKDTQCF